MTIGLNLQSKMGMGRRSKTHLPLMLDAATSPPVRNLRLWAVKIIARWPRT